MKDTQAGISRPMVHKKVSVDVRSKEFQEDSPKRKTPISEVRNFVKDLKQQQNKILQKSRVHNSSYQAADQPFSAGDLVVAGHATGSNFYPHNITSNGVSQKYG
jgi:hypothetical protein